jgi:hypothetical protein
VRCFLQLDRESEGRKFSLYDLFPDQCQSLRSFANKGKLWYNCSIRNVLNRANTSASDIQLIK